MLDKAHLADLKERHASFVRLRREIIGTASAAQSESKRAIFALHRDDTQAADELLASAEKRFAGIRSIIAGRPELGDEGAYRAALEEFAEASLYRMWVKDGTVGALSMEGIDHAIEIGGLSDLTGELQRRQVRLATEGKLDQVKLVKDEIEAIVTSLLEMDLEGYLRTKFDQAKNSLRRAEEVLYETTLRRG